MPPSTAVQGCEICINQSHRTLKCPLYPHNALTNLAAIRAEKVQMNNNRSQKPPRCTPRFQNGSRRRFNDNPQSLSFSHSNTKALNSPRNATPMKESDQPLENDEEPSKDNPDPKYWHLVPSALQKDEKKLHSSITTASSHVDCTQSNRLQNGQVFCSHYQQQAHRQNANAIFSSLS